MTNLGHRLESRQARVAVRPINLLTINACRHDYFDGQKRPLYTFKLLSRQRRTLQACSCSMQSQHLHRTRTTPHLLGICSPWPLWLTARAGCVLSASPLNDGVTRLEYSYREARQGIS